MNDPADVGRLAVHLRKGESVERKEELVVCCNLLPGNESDWNIGTVESVSCGSNCLQCVQPSVNLGNKDYIIDN